MHSACQSKIDPIEKIDLILSSDEYINKCNKKGFAPLHFAVLHENGKVLGHILKAKYLDVNLQSSICGTPLHVTASYGMFNAARILLNHKQLNVMIQDANGDTVLHHTVRGG